MSLIIPFVDDASNWYVRRSRRRFWKSEDDTDKNEAYLTLYTILEQLALILAPFTPFLSEELWHKLVDEKGSVHLQDWPPADSIDEKVIKEMAECRQIIEKGLALRMERNDEYGQIKVRQPLARLSYSGIKLDDFYEQIIAEEVNVKSVEYIDDIESYTKHHDTTEGKIRNGDFWVEVEKKLTPELRAEGIAREIIRFVQNARKNAGLNIDDRINLKLVSGDKMYENVLQTYDGVIRAETLAVGDKVGPKAYSETVKIENSKLEINLEKA